MNITLIGMPGSGKSYVGKMLADRLRFAFIDTDTMLEQRFGMPLQAAVETLGAEKFLDEESALIIEAVRHHDGFVLSPGGSVVLREQTMQELAGASTVVYLQAGLPVLRMRIAGTSRGIVGDKPFEQIFAERFPVYERWAAVTVDAEAWPDAVVAGIMSALQAGDADPKA